MQETKIEPWTPPTPFLEGGISPVGTGTPALRDLKIPRPYVPEGTFYRMFKSNPGFPQVHDTIANKTNIVDYSPHSQKRNPFAVDQRRKPQVRYSRYTKTDPLQILKTHPKYGHGPGKQSGYGSEDYIARKLRRNPVTVGWHNAYTNTTVVPHRDSLVHDSKKIRRHEFAHRTQSPKLKGILTPEVNANIVEYKSVRKGLDDIAYDYPAYKADRINHMKSYEGKFPYSKKVVGKEIAKSALASGALKTANKAMNAIPSQPGFITGRVPTFRAFGGGLIDMFMEGPEMQKAKTDPYYGLPKKQKQRIENAWIHGT
jgi:hypothetical protein